MKKSAIYEIAIKLGGLYLFFLSIMALKDVFVFGISYLKLKEDGFQDFDGNNIYIVLGAISSFTLILAFAFFLTFHSEKIVRKICRAEEFETEINLKITKQGLYEIGLVISSFVLILDTLPNFLVKFREYLNLTEKDYLIGYDRIGFLWVAIARMIVGVLVIAGADMISSFIVKEKKTDSEI